MRRRAAVLTQHSDHKAGRKADSIKVGDLAPKAYTLTYTSPHVSCLFLTPFLPIVHCFPKLGRNLAISSTKTNSRIHPPVDCTPWVNHVCLPISCAHTSYRYMVFLASQFMEDMQKKSNCLSTFVTNAWHSLNTVSSCSQCRRAGTVEEAVYEA